MLTFNQAETKLGNRSSKKLGNNTYLERIDSDTFGVKLHNTYVVKIHRDGKFTLNSGGFRTSTTKKRINDYSPKGIYQKNYEWFMSDSGNFVDNMQVS